MPLKRYRVQIGSVLLLVGLLMLAFLSICLANYNFILAMSMTPFGEELFRTSVVGVAPTILIGLYLVIRKAP
jgi:hypothetical protein